MNTEISDEPQITLAWSDAVDKIAPAYLQAQKNMGDVLKKATNPAFKSKYADLAAVVEAVEPAFNEAGIAVIQSPSAAYNGTAKVSIDTLLLHSSGQWLRSRLTMQPTKSDPQAVGSAITYGRRYSLQSLSGVAPEDDDGNHASRKPDPQPPAAAPPPNTRVPEPIEREEAEAILALLDRANKPAAKTIAWATANRTDDAFKLTPHEAETLSKRLYQALDKQKGTSCEACLAKADKSGAIEHEYDPKGVPCPNDVSRAAEIAREAKAKSDERAAAEEATPF